MKKITKIILLVTAFFAAKGTCAAGTLYYFKVGNTIPNIKVHIKTDNYEEDREITEIKKDENNQIFFSLNPKMIYENSAYEQIYYIADLDNNLTDDDWDNLSYITYFGYGYQNRTNSKWYAITQFMIWDYMLQDKGDIYFIDEFGNKTDKYQEELNQIKKEIEEFRILPSFLDSEENMITLGYKEELILEDKNEVLNNYEIESNDEIERNSNYIKLCYNEPGYKEIIFYRKIESNNLSSIYKNGNNGIISTGIHRQDNNYLYIQVANPYITISKKVINGYSLKGTKYLLTNESNTLTYILELDEFGFAKSWYIPLDKYSLKELEVPNGYKKSEEEIIFNLNTAVYNISLESTLATKTITLASYIKNDLEIKTTNDIFEIYNEKDELINRLSTDEYGKAKIALPYGKYIIKSMNGSKTLEMNIDKNYNESESINFVEIEEMKKIEEEKVPNTIIEKETKEQEINYGSIELNSIDSTTNEPLKNQSYELYNNNLELLEESKTSEDGKIEFDNLEVGTYYIKNRDFNEEYKIEVKNNIKSILTIPNRMKVKVPNTGVNEFLVTLIISVCLLLFGCFICNHEK